MRVLVISDMEGVSGICRWEQVTGGNPQFDEARRLYTEEINAAVRGARAAGATEVVVMDCHGAGEGWSFNSLVADLLDPGCEWVVQNEWTEYTAFLEEGCDAALLIGMHARAGTPDGVLSHTVSGTDWRNLWFNGQPVGETGINAALCGQWGCPVVMVSGDRATCAEATSLLGSGVAAVEVKEGLGRYSARHIPPTRARSLIAQAAEKALGTDLRPQPFVPESPCEIKVELALSDGAERWSHKDGVAMLDSRTVVSTGAEWWTAWRRLYL
ncbi:MAG: M55 family metallopeptidase [Actinobacteria bacterium]|nr:M55 family metallopeptidase [Actinomycetota bacterium]